MPNYKLSNAAKDDLIRIQQYGIRMFDMIQADMYFDSFFEYFDLIASNPYSFESIEHIRNGYRRCVCGSDSIYFRLSNDQVEIMAIIGKQDLESRL